MSSDSLPFRLKAHSTARSQAVAYSPLSAGSTILSSEPLAWVLLESEKGQRCDWCFRARKELQRCASCKHYWYCDSTCQMKAWKAHHRRLCKSFSSYLTSHSYKRLSSPEQAHFLLLSHLLAEHSKALWLTFSTKKLPSDDLSDPIIVLLSLLPRIESEALPELPHLDSIPASLISYLSCRFSNNNFTIHSSRMDVFAHGIFPLASRSFNHSCVPSAVPVYTVSSTSAIVKMNIQLIHDLKAGEEITIPYIDPALPLTSRQHYLNLTYNFTCSCPLCRRPWNISATSSVSPSELTNLDSRLRDTVLPILLQDEARIESLKLRENLVLAFHPSYLPSVAEAFSQTSHEGPYDIAVQKGATLLALYRLIYPAHYPLIGLHALELAKTCWNAFVTDAVSRSALLEMETYLALAERTFSVLWRRITETTGYDPEPLSELRQLKELVNTETKSDKS